MFGSCRNYIILYAIVRYTNGPRHPRQKNSNITCATVQITEFQNTRENEDVFRSRGNGKKEERAAQRGELEILSDVV